MSVCLSVGWSVFYTVNGLLLHVCLFLQNYSFRSQLFKKVTCVLGVPKKSLSPIQTFFLSKKDHHRRWIKHKKGNNFKHFLWEKVVFMGHPISEFCSKHCV